jgi:hypothetical protein
MKKKKLGFLCPTHFSFSVIVCEINMSCYGAITRYHCTVRHYTVPLYCAPCYLCAIYKTAFLRLVYVTYLTSTCHVVGTVHLYRYLPPVRLQPTVGKYEHKSKQSAMFLYISVRYLLVRMFVTWTSHGNAA